MIGSTTFQAFVRRDYHPWGTCRLFVAEGWGTGQVRQLMADGTWQVIPEAALAEEAGLVLPVAALDAMFEAIKVFRGELVDSTTEAKVLREWLEAERARVERLIFPGGV